MTNRKNSTASWWAKFTPEERKAKRREYGSRSYAKNKSRVLKKQREYRAAHKDLIKTQSDKYRATHLEKARASSKRYADANRERMRELIRAYAKANLEKAKERKNKWRMKAENKEKDRAYTRAWRASNLERSKIAYKKWRVANKDKLASLQSKYRAKVLCATPKWANGFFIEEAYDLASRRSKMLGFKWHVDHVVPLKSKIVCGLHCEQNLRVIPGIENIKKGNRHWPDMP